MKKLLALLLLLPIISLANPIDDKCKQHVVYGAPALKDGDNQYLCRTSYAVNYNYKTKVAYYVVEHITPEKLVKSTSRKDDFREDPEVPVNHRSTLSDYAKSGYDRGHMAPAADMTFDVVSMSESFYLTNMMPQNPGNNRGIWKYLEEYTRYWAQTKGEVFVITGTIFDDKPIMMKSVSVPSFVYKIVIDPKSGKQIAYMFPNEKLDPKKIDDYAVSVADLESYTGINFSPLLPASLKNNEKTILKMKEF
jgi:endonuclease G